MASGSICPEPDVEIERDGSRRTLRDAVEARPACRSSFGLRRVVVVRLLGLAEPRVAPCTRRRCPARTCRSAGSCRCPRDRSRSWRPCARALLFHGSSVEAQRCAPSCADSCWSRSGSPAPFSCAIESGGGTSIQSTWPLRSAARRVVGSGIGKQHDACRPSGVRFESQYCLVRLELEPLARHEARDLERPGARRLLRELPPVLHLVPLRRRHDQHVARSGTARSSRRSGSRTRPCSRRPSSSPSARRGARRSARSRTGRTGGAACS